jgi:N-acetylglucosamine-6-phosphate deacetylase
LKRAGEAWLNARMSLGRTSLFDLQVNGFAGVDFQREGLSAVELRMAVEALHRHETRRILLTLISDEPDALCRKFAHFEALRKSDALIAETVCGYHLEGPFLSAEEGYRGAHPAAFQRAPDLALFRRLQSAAGGRIRLLTLAPEWSGSAEFIGEVTRAGVVVSLGHTNASENEIDAAIRAGATLCTHLGNGVPQMLPRHDNVIQRLLARDELTACLIPDGVHLPPFVLRNLFRAKPPGKVLLTTDAMAAAAAPPGRYTLGTIDVESRDGAVRQLGQANLAGSCLTPERGVENAAQWLGIAAEEARALFSTRAAAHFGIDLPALEPA